MEDIYKLMEQSGSGRADTQAFDKDAWAERKQAEREQVYALIDETCLEVNADEAARESYVGVMARFPNHSAANALLVHKQRPDATRIGDSSYWARQGTHVLRGERGLSILEPGREYEREDGSVGTFYDVRKVFDVSQTTARARLPRSYDANTVLAALIAKSPVPIRPADDLGGELAVYNHEAGRIDVQKGLSEPQLFWALATELAHESMARGAHAYDRNTAANKAQLAAAVLAKRYGMEGTQGFAPPPAAPDAAPKDIRAALTEVRNAACDISERMRDVLDKPRHHEQSMTR